jgi:hypothetical protein
MIILFSLSCVALLCNCHGSKANATPEDETDAAMQKEVVDTGQERFVVDEATKERIDSWIKRNNLNRYGDPKGTAYVGGTPLFNMKTGKTMDRYQYILKKHPELLTSQEH